MKITLSCLLLLFISTSVFAQKIKWYSKEERQQQIEEAQKEDPVIQELLSPYNDLPLLDQYSIRMQKAGRQINGAGIVSLLSLGSAVIPLLDPGNLTLAYAAGGFSIVTGLVSAACFVSAGNNIIEAGRLYKDHHLQLQLEATQNGIGMVMRF